MGKGNSSAKKIFTVIGNVIIWLFVIFSALVTLYFAVHSGDTGIPSIGNTTILTVATDSMKGTIEEGDLIFGEKLLPDEQKALKVGDIVTYETDINGDNVRDFNTHRIIEVIPGENGTVSYRTKGDNPLAGADPEPVDSSLVVCKYTGTRLAYVGKALDFLKTTVGFIVCIIAPLVILFLFELIKLIRKFLEAKGAGSGKLTPEEEERIRQQAVEEYLRSKGEEAPAEAEEKPENDG